MQLWGVPTRLLAVFMLLSSMALIATGAAAQTPAPAPAKAPAATTGIPPAKVSKTWTGDFDGMVKRRVIRVLVPYSKTSTSSIARSSAAFPTRLRSSSKRISTRS